MARHADATVGNVHIIYNWTYADETAREAAIGMVAGDVGKFCRQLDDNTIWMLTDDDPVTWVLISGTTEDATAIHTDGSAEISALSGKDTPVGADMVLIEDSEASNAKKKVLLSNLLKIITGLTEETTPEDADLVLIQQAADGALRKVQVSNLPGGGGGGFTTGDVQKVELFRETLLSDGKFDTDGISLTGFDDIEIELMVRSSVSSADDALLIFFNNDLNNNNYFRERLTATGTSASASSADSSEIRTISGNNAPANSYTYVTIRIPNYALTSNLKGFISTNGNRTGSSTAYIQIIYCEWESAVAITRIAVQTDNDPTDKLMAGSTCRIYGIKTTA